MDADSIIKEALREILSTDVGELLDDTNLVSDGYIDSLESLRLLFIIEKKLGRKIYEDHELSLDSFNVSELKKRMA